MELLRAPRDVNLGTDGRTQLRDARERVTANPHHAPGTSLLARKNEGVGRRTLVLLFYLVVRRVIDRVVAVLFVRNYSQAYLWLLQPERRDGVPTCASGCRRRQLRLRGLSDPNQDHRQGFHGRSRSRNDAWLERSTDAKDAMGGTRRGCELQGLRPRQERR